MKQYKRSLQEDSDEERIVIEYLVHTNGHLYEVCGPEITKYYLDLPDISLKFDSLEGLIDFMLIDMDEWEEFDKAFAKEV